MKRIIRTSISLLLFVALLLPMALNGSITAKADTQPEGVFAGWSATLTDDIAVNFYFRIHEEAVSSTTLNITVAGESYPSVAAADAAVKNGCRVFTVNIAAAQMTDTIHLELVNGENTVHTDDYTLRQYADAILTGEYDDGTKALVKKMLNFGAAAQVYFNHNADNLANSGYELADADLVDPVSAGNREINGEVPGLSPYGMSLVFQSKTAVRFYFNTDDCSGYTFKVGDTVYTPQSKNGMYYVEVDGINPYALDELITLTVTDGTNTMTVAYSPLYYMANRFAKSSNESLRAVVKAMFNYAMEANVYLPVTPAKPENTAELKNSAGFLTFADLPANPLDPAQIEEYKALGFTTALLTEDYSRALAYYATVDEGLDTVALTDGQKALELTFTGYTGEGTMLQIKTNLPTDGSYANFLVDEASSKGYTFNAKSARTIGWMELSYDAGSNAVYLNPHFNDSFMDGEKFIIKAGTTFPVNGTNYVLCHDYIVTMHNDYLASIDNLYNAGLNVWIRNYNNQPEYFTANLTKALLNYKDKISGIYIADEAFDTEDLMNAVNQGDISTSFDAIAATEISWFETNFPNAYFHTNQVPISSYDHYGDGKEPADYAVAYNDFLNSYSTKILSNLETAGKSMCYDNYPFIEKTRDLSNFWKDRQVLYDGYLFNMLLAANAAKNAPEGTDFGVCIQTFTGTGMRDITTSEEVTFQLYTAMALGADMFEYFAYSSNSGMNGIIRDGQKALYDLVKSANNEALPFGEIIRAYDWQGIQLVSGATHDNATDFTKITDSHATLGSVTLNDDTNGLLSAVSTTRDAVIGCFTQGDKNGYMVVNYNDPVKKAYNNDVTLTFAGCQTATVYTSENGAIKSEFVTLTDGAYSATVKPGKAFFIVPDAPINLNFVYRYGTNSLIQVNTNLPSGTPCKDFLAGDNGCNIDQSANEYQQFGYASMSNVDGTIVLTFNFGKAFEAGQTYILKSGSVFGFTDGSSYTLEKDYVFTWDGSNWTVSNELPAEPIALEFAYRYGTNSLIQVNTNLPSGTKLKDFTAGENGCNIDQSLNEYQQVGWIGMDNVDGTIVLTFHFNNAFEAGQTYIIKSGSVFGFTDGTSYTLEKDYVFTWDGSNWTVSNEIPIDLNFAYRYGTDSLIQVNTNLPSGTTCANFTAGDNGCNIDQTANEYQQVGWIGMDNVDGTIVLTFHFNSAFEAGQTYILKSGSVFGFTDGNSYTLDKDYVFTWDGSAWTMSNEIPVSPSVTVMNMAYRWGGANVLQVNTDLPSDTPTADFLADDNGCVLDQSASDYLLGYASMVNDNGTIVLTFNFTASTFNRGEQYVLKRGSVFGFTNGKTYTLDKDYVFTWDGTVWTMTNEIPATMTLAYRWGAAKVLQVNTDLPSTTPIASFLAGDNGCNLNQDGSAQQFGWAAMANADGTIVLTFNFGSEYTSGQKYILKRGSVFGFTDGNKYRLDRDYIFTWDGSNWSLS